MLLAIDPGLSTGWAVWGSGLVSCGLGDPPRVDAGTLVWIEKPVIYPHARAKPNDILTLALGAGEWGRRYKALGADVHYVEPRTWKGSVPKDVHHARVWAVLTARDQMIVSAAAKGITASKRHNVMDAVALGMWARDRGGK